MKRSLLIYICTLLFALTSCQNDVDEALQNAGNNRAQLEYVLQHFKHHPDKLRYRAAKFLIANMPFHGSFYGKGAKQYALAYQKMAIEPLEFRDSVLRKELKNVDSGSSQYIPDLRKIDAKTLIKAIDDACDTWESVTWHGDYSEDIFFDYVLPYRVANEPMSDWRTCVKRNFPYIDKDITYSSRGLQLSASKAKTKNCKVVNEPSALNGQSVVLTGKPSSVDFQITSDIPSDRLLNLRYTSTTKDAKAVIKLNGKAVTVFELEPTKSMHVFRNSRSGIKIRLARGTNTLTICFDNQPFGLDYIELAGIEKYSEPSNIDFSNSFCQIKNITTGHFVSMDTLQGSMLKPISLRRYSRHDRTLDLRIENLGYACWKIAPGDSSNQCIEDRWVSLDPLAPVGKFNYLRGNHQKWVIIPIGHGLYKIMNKDSGMFWESTVDTNTKNEIIVQNVYSGKKSQQWAIIPTKKTFESSSIFKLASAQSAALRVYDVMRQFEFVGNRGEATPSLASLLKYRTGICDDEASYTVALSRFLGIPTAIDFTPHWGNRTNGHSWSVLILPTGKGTPFYMGCVPGDTAQYFHSYLKPKIYRHRFQLNRSIVEDLRQEKEVPTLFRAPDYVDVTDEYYHTTDVTRQIPEEFRNNRIAYICVFDKEEWIPVDYGKIRRGHVTFKSMGRNILYSVGLYKNGKIAPIGCPFVIMGEGSVRDIKPRYGTRMSMTLLRKYPFFGKEDYFNGRMAYGKFQGDNDADFKNPTTLYQHEGITEGCWYMRALKKSDKTFKYLRYIGFTNSYCNINELEFYDEYNRRIKGTIIGTQGTEGHTKETVFDGDILTGFNGISPDGHWVGIKLSHPQKVLKIRYMPRNDGNSIEVGDVYQLLMYERGLWKTMGWKRARMNHLVFPNMPSNGLFILKDKTKGVEERIFTYEHGKQVWW